LREPPSYELATSKTSPQEEEVAAAGPPPYTAAPAGGDNKKHNNNTTTNNDSQETIHFLAPDDTLLSLSLRYGIPAPHLHVQYNRQALQPNVVGSPPAIHIRLQGDILVLPLALVIIS